MELNNLCQAMPAAMYQSTLLCIYAMLQFFHKLFQLHQKDLLASFTKIDPTKILFHMVGTYVHMCVSTHICMYVHNVFVHTLSYVCTYVYRICNILHIYIHMYTQGNIRQIHSCRCYIMMHLVIISTTIFKVQIAVM